MLFYSVRILPSFIDIFMTGMNCRGIYIIWYNRKEFNSSLHDSIQIYIMYTILSNQSSIKTIMKYATPSEVLYVKSAGAQKK